MHPVIRMIGLALAGLLGAVGLIAMAALLGALVVVTIAGIF